MASTYIPRNTHQKGTYQIWHFHILNATAQATRTITHCQRYNVRKTFTLWTVRKKNYTINWLDLLVQRFIFICLLLHRRWSKWYVCELRKNKTIKAPTFRDLVNSESALHRCRMCVDFIVDIFTTCSKRSMQPYKLYTYMPSMRSGFAARNYVIEYVVLIYWYIFTVNVYRVFGNWFNLCQHFQFQY